MPRFIQQKGHETHRHFFSKRGTLHFADGLAETLGLHVIFDVFLDTRPQTHWNETSTCFLFKKMMSDEMVKRTIDTFLFKDT